MPNKVGDKDASSDADPNALFYHKARDEGETPSTSGDVADDADPNALFYHHKRNDAIRPRTKDSTEAGDTQADAEPDQLFYHHRRDSDSVASAADESGAGDADPEQLFYSHKRDGDADKVQNNNSDTDVDAKPEELFY